MPKAAMSFPTAAAFLLAGFLLGQGGLGVLSPDPRSGEVVGLAEIALVVILFRDGLEVEGEMLVRAWSLPMRKLVLTMPITGLLVALVTRLATHLSWGEALLLGALLSPTDPVLSSGIVTNPRVPRLVRHSLNLESGLNDGLALPAVLAFSASLETGPHHFVWWSFVLRDVLLGLAGGVALGLVSSWILPRTRPLVQRSVGGHRTAFALLGCAAATYGATVLLVGANGFIAVFVAAITLGVRRPDLRTAFERDSGELVELVKLAVFLVFGSLLTARGLTGAGWGGLVVVVATLFLVRPIGVWVALAGTGTSSAVKAFMAWFGPKGVATMTFSLLILGRHVSSGGEIFNLAALTVCASVFVHGLTDGPGVGWIARRTTGSAGQTAAGQTTDPI